MIVYMYMYVCNRVRKQVQAFTSKLIQHCTHTYHKINDNPKKHRMTNNIARKIELVSIPEPAAIIILEA